MTGRYTTRSATYITSLNLAAKVAERGGAFVQILLIASIYGATARSDLYFIASIVPLTVGTVVAEALATSALPVALAREKEGDLQSFLVGTFWGAAAALAITLAAYLAVAWTVVNSFAPAGSTDFMPWVAFSPTIVTLGLSSYLSALLLQQERYTWPPFRAAIATICGLFFMGAALIFTRSLTWIAVGTSCGYLLSCLLLLGDLTAASGRSFMRRPRAGDLRLVRPLAGNFATAIVGGILGGQLFVLVERSLAASVGVGAVSTISYARGVIFSTNIVAQAIAMGLYPGMTRAHVAADKRFVANAFVRGLRLTLLASLLAIVFACLYAEPLIHTLLQHGALTNTDSRAIAHALIAFSPAVVGSMLLIVTSRVFYAINSFRGIVWSQLGVLVVYLPLAVLLRGAFGATGIAAAFGTAELFGGLVATALVSTRLSLVRLDFACLRGVIRPIGGIGLALLAVRAALDRAPLSVGVRPVVITVVGGVVMAGLVIASLLRSRWPETEIVRRGLQTATARLLRSFLRTEPR